VIAYSTPGKLMKTSATGGGPPQMLCAFNTTTIVGRGGAWSRDGVIVFNNGPGPLFRVSSAGGQPTAVGRLPKGHLSHNFPTFLPDGRHVVFYAAGSSSDSSGVHVAALDTGQATRVLEADTGAIYSQQGRYLLYVRRGTLLAQSFDAKTLTLSGEPYPVADRVESSPIPGMVPFSVSDGGILAYVTGPGTSAGLQLVWVDRHGSVIEAVGPRADYRGVDLSADGRHLAARRTEAPGGDVWVSDLVRGTSTRFTFDASQENLSPIWSPDGRLIVFASSRDGRWGLFQKPSNNTGAEERLLESAAAVYPMSWASDGQSLVYQVNDANTAQDLSLLSLSGARKAVPLLNTRFAETSGQISPDGKWLAYSSNETGRPEVFVQPFPSGPGKWLVSTNGGIFPRWRRDGGELFYISDLKLVAAPVKAVGSTFEAGAAKTLFETGYIDSSRGRPYHAYAVAADGQRFLMARPAATDSESVPPSIAVVLNWSAALPRP
jgi:Tol biopolymer transport system component